MNKIDIIIPVYRTEKYLERCVNSLLNQTMDGIRIILVDDGSDDRCPDICDFFEAKYNSVTVIHKENGGQSTARNRGLDIVDAEYVMFVDSDDYVREDACRLAYEKCKAEEADVLSFGVQMVDFDGNRIRKLPPNVDGMSGVLTEEERRKLIFSFGHIWNKIYKSDLIRDIRFPEGLFYEDYYYSAVVASRVNKLSLLNEELYFYCANPTSTTHSPRPGHEFDKWAVMQAIEEYYKQNQIYERYSESLEYLYSMFCFVNASISALISYKQPLRIVLYARREILNRYPDFTKNRYYQSRVSKRNKFIATGIIIAPRSFVFLVRIKRRRKK